MGRGERRRTALAAVQERNAAILWSLTEAWVRTFGKSGAAVADDTIRSYRTGVQRLLAAWAQQDLLRPEPEAAATWVRGMERAGLKPATVNARVAAGRALYAALRWAGAVTIDPFADVHVATDKTPPWEKRAPYEEDELTALLRVAEDPLDRVLVLLGAHTGLRAQECVDLRWADIDLVRRRLVVRRGKGGKTRSVSISGTLAAALQCAARDRSGFVLPYRRTITVWRHMRALCAAAGVAPKGVHALRHSAGTRLYAETSDLETTARHLGHSTLETARVYAKWSDRRLTETVGEW
jgi:integrase/recombinase XerC